MDPDTCLLQIRTLVKEIRELVDMPKLSRDQRQVLEQNAAELADAADAMDEWLSDGGYRPAAWQRKEGT